MLSALIGELDGIDPGGGLVPIKAQKKVPRNQVKITAQVKKKVPTGKQKNKLVSAQKRTRKISSKGLKTSILLKSSKATQGRMSPQKVGDKNQPELKSPQGSAEKISEGFNRKSKFDPSMELVRETVIANLRESLLGQKTLILNKSRNIEEEALMSPSDGVQDEADQASRQLSLNLSLNLHERDRSSLFLIEKALSRIQNGSYGHCDLCGIEIGLRRLQARPFASLCIDCMQDQEDLRLNSSPS
ncbi:MAG: TraR/DksA family transcriptional regulator [Bdellovibrio sp.]